MASRQNVDNSAVNERRLRPIYDCLDNGMNKKAVTEADRVLKKQKDFQCAKVLKSLALIRLQRQDEAIAILKEVHDQAPTEDATLQAMTICYRELKRVDLLANVYERAASKDPQNEEILSHLFMAYVRLNDYKKQQLTATQLFKLKSKNPYYFWSIMSLYMQAINEKDVTIREKMLLPLAEAKAKKFVDENKIESEAEVELYLMILEKQNKWQQMLDILNGPLAHHLKNYLQFLTKRKAVIYEKLERDEEAYDIYKSLIEHHPDQFEFYGKLCELAFRMDAKKQSEDECHMKHLINLVIKCSDRAYKKGSKTKLRAPNLTRICLYYEVNGSSHPFKNSMQKQITNNVEDLIVNYYTNFGHKLAFDADFKYILEHYKESNDDFVKAIHQIREQRDFSQAPTTIDELFYYYNFYSLQISVNTPSSIVDRHATIIKLIYFYEKTVDMNKEKFEKEINPANYFFILIVNLWTKEKEDSSLTIILITMLEMALQKSSFDHNLKLMLINLYNLIGASRVSEEKFESLDIKHIQQDALGYLIYTPMHLTGQLKTLESMLELALRFYSSNLKDTNDFLISCYKFGSFTKVEEILALKERLSSSLQYKILTCEKMFLEVLLETNSQELAVKKINYFDATTERTIVEDEVFFDNSDIQIYNLMSVPEFAKIKDNKNRCFKSNVFWYRLRHETLKLIATLYDLLKASEQDGEKTEAINSLKSISDSIDHLRKVWDESIASEDIKLLENTIFGISTTRLESYTRAPFFDALHCLFSLVFKMLQNLLTKDSNEIKSSDLNTLLSTICQTINAKKMCKHVDDHRLLLELFVNFADLLSISTVVLGVVSSILKSQINFRRKKKGPEEPNKHEMLTAYEQTVKVIETAAKEVMKQLKAGEFDIKNHGSAKFQHDMLESPDFNEKHAEIVTKIERSYQTSQAELEEVLNGKLKYLQSLKI